MTSHGIWVGKIKEVMKSIKEKCRKSENYMFYTNDITCNLSRWNKGRNEICKRRMQKICEYFSIFFTIFVGMLLTCVALVRRIDIFDFLFFLFFFLRISSLFTVPKTWETRKSIFNSNYTGMIFVFLNYVWNRIFIIF